MPGRRQLRGRRYYGQEGNFSALIETLSGGTWTRATAPLPEASLAGGRARRSFLPSPHDLRGRRCLQRPGPHRARPNRDAVPRNLDRRNCTLAAGITAATLLAVACPAPGMCAATGETGLLAGNSHALVETLSGSNWTPVKVALPPGATVTAGARLSGVACPAVGTCVAAGFYTGPDRVLGLGGGASSGRCPGCLATR